MALDLTAILSSYVVFAILRYDGRPPPWFGVLTIAAVAAVVHLGLCVVLKLYRGRASVASLDETVALGLVALAAALVAQTVNVLVPMQLAARAIPIGAGFMAVGVMVFVRAQWRRYIRSTEFVTSDLARRTLVVGAGSAAEQLILSMRTDPMSPFVPVALLDDDPWKRHLRLDGVPVRGRLGDLEATIAREQVEVVVVAITTASPELLRDLSDRATTVGVDVKVLPAVGELLGTKASIRDVRDINIADLLGRGAIETDISSIAGFLNNKRVLVTGAGGSIGSELCRQIAKWHPAELMMLDRDESALHGVQLTLHGAASLDSPEVILADIRDREALLAVFEERRPQVVFHAAALKHLNMLEQYPLEAVKTNVLGTQNVLEVSQAVGVERFVNISTDKAADPTSVLGYSKRVAERLTADMARRTEGAFMSVRFGNVLGSRGSVLTTFAAQIAQGGPLTVTHPNVTRYFMTVSEAVQLVIQAGAIGSDGEVLILDMGEPVRIDDVARQLIEQSGRPIEIVYTGLREGEKLEEILLAGVEEDNRPVHELISHVRVAPLGAAQLQGAQRSGSRGDATASLRDWCFTDAAGRPGGRLTVGR
ncbi:nucleoside-diphosphate sugar epimerase/dehydratase [Nocardioides sp.]|uniref:polysaccharide biosynthesis protein n=1 Tax=Nocardioides sp. TaxID=35761 RepID=UPI002732D2D5|nr:nucleoside-diphosphate sugar epimerase/dehydratase [Nocardioides sp.]MDP3893772.1 nucleoside-diphosphate sugar epimerase/dehydratase [Nocardioides sp.]